MFGRHGLLSERTGHVARGKMDLALADRAQLETAKTLMDPLWGEDPHIPSVDRAPLRDAVGVVQCGSSCSD